MHKFLNQLVCGDCIEILDAITEPFADLIFADPPFNIGYKYDKYHDKVDRNNYIAWTKGWMTACKKVLKPHGSFYIAIGDDFAANIKVIADELGLFMRNWIIWHYTFGQQAKGKFARSHTHIFYFVLDKENYIFNDWSVRVPSGRQLIYNDRRANPEGKIPDDVWLFSRVCGTFKERSGWHPCQMPENLLKRIISVSSNQGDCVLDPFSGSGTTAVAAFELGRNYTGIDISADYIRCARQRLSTVKKRKQGNLFLNVSEANELKRLLCDVSRTPDEICSDRNLLELFTAQLSIRTNKNRSFLPEEVAAVLRNMAF